MKISFLASLTAAAVSLVWLTAAVAAEPHARSAPRKYLGVFSDVQLSSGSGDCGGYSLRLWSSKNPDGSISLSGTFYAAAGSCPGLKMDIAAVAYVPRTGALEFTAAAANEQDPHPAKFKGTLLGNVVRGKLSFIQAGTAEAQPWGDISLPRIDDKRWLH